jgi:HPt (histidine-containing phosphotransfer) domain-containing protein
MYISMDYIMEVTRGNKESSQKLLKVAITQLNTQMELLQKAILENDMEEISKRAHCMKNALHILGIYTHVTIQIEALENNAQNTTQKILSATFNKMNSTIQIALKEANQLLN